MEAHLNEPSAEEVVAWAERRLDDGMNPIYLPERFARALIASWREQREALEQAEAVFSIVMPRSNAAEYRRVLGVVRAALKDKPSP
jgi:N-acetyl-beta-hexosaminidase